MCIYIYIIYICTYIHIYILDAPMGAKAPIFTEPLPNLCMIELEGGFLFRLTIF